MASLITDADKLGFTGMLADHFDTFKTRDCHIQRSSQGIKKRNI